MPDPTNTPADNPYVGPLTFSKAQAHLFFGRDREAEELLSLVIAKRLTVFYAQSGAGKSSLINTCLIPDLEAADFTVLPVARVNAMPPADAPAPANVFAYSVMLSLVDQRQAATDFLDVPLSTFMTRLTTDDGETYHYDLTFADDDEAYESGRYVLIIDQFEELFTTHLLHWEQRADFFRQVTEMMVAEPNLWLVLVMREDYIAYLEPHANLVQDRFRARFYMQRLAYKAALAAVKTPCAEAATPRPYASGVAEVLVNELRQIRLPGQDETVAGQFVEPVQLQVVCHQLWETLKATPGDTITHEDLQAAGDIDVSLGQFYEQALADVIQDTEVSEVAVRRWFDNVLITEAKTRSTVYQGETQTGELDNAVVQALEKRHLLRAENRAGGRWVELVHDRFVQPIRDTNQAWRLDKPLISLALDWDEAGRSKNKLLGGRELQRLQQTDWQTLGDLVAAFMAESDLAEKARQQEETRRQRELEQAQALAQEAEKRRQAEAQRAQEAEAREVEQARASRLQSRLLIGLGAVLLFSIGVTLFALGQLNLAQARQLGASAQVAFDNDDIKSSILLALEAKTLEVSNVNAQRLLGKDIPSKSLTYFPGKRLTEHADWVLSVSWHPDGTRLASASDDNTVIIWDVETWQPLQTLTEHAGWVNSVSWHPDGTRLASASSDNTVSLIPEIFTQHPCQWWGFENMPLDQWKREKPTAIYRPTCDNLAFTPIPLGINPDYLLYTVNGRFLAIGLIVVSLTVLGLIIWGLYRLFRWLRSRRLAQPPSLFVKWLFRILIILKLVGIIATVIALYFDSSDIGILFSLGLILFGLLILIVSFVKGRSYKTVLLGASPLIVALLFIGWVISFEPSNALIESVFVWGGLIYAVIALPLGILALRAEGSVRPSEGDGTPRFVESGAGESDY